MMLSNSKFKNVRHRVPENLEDVLPFRLISHIFNVTSLLVQIRVDANLQVVSKRIVRGTQNPVSNGDRYYRVSTRLPSPHFLSI